MRTLTCAVIVLSCVGLALLGCTDKSQSVVAPTDQAVNSPSGPMGLAKTSLTHFTATDVYNPTAGGTQWSRGARLISKGEELEDQLTATDPRVTGVEHSWGNGVNAAADPVTFDGTAHGKLTITVDEAGGGGVWEGTWEGLFSGGILNLKAECHGIGGAVDGLQLSYTETFNLFSPAPGDIDGYIREH
jgi:hypothetical protein